MKKITLTTEELTELLYLNPPKINRALEISMIAFLGKSQSYFADGFSALDLNTMKINIENGCPILMGTEIDKELTKLQQANTRISELKDQVGALDQELDGKDKELEGSRHRIDSIMEAMLIENEKRDRQGLSEIECVQELFDMKTIIRKKLQLRISLNQLELDFIKETL